MAVAEFWREGQADRNLSDKLRNLRHKSTATISQRLQRLLTKTKKRQEEAHADGESVALSDVGAFAVECVLQMR